MKPSEREYTGVTQYFHNYEHDPEGLTHCRGPAGNPYRIVHFQGKHIINTEYAKGHGKGNIPQWFRFTKRFGLGWDLTSEIKVDSKDVPERGKTKIYFRIKDEPILKSKLDHNVVRDKLKDLPPLNPEIKRLQTKYNLTDEGLKKVAKKLGIK